MSFESFWNRSKFPFIVIPPVVGKELYDERTKRIERVERRTVRAQNRREIISSEQFNKKDDHAVALFIDSSIQDYQSKTQISNDLWRAGIVNDPQDIELEVEQSLNLSGNAVRTGSKWGCGFTDFSGEKRYVENAEKKASTRLKKIQDLKMTQAFEERKLKKNYKNKEKEQKSKESEKNQNSEQIEVKQNLNSTGEKKEISFPQNNYKSVEMPLPFATIGQSRYYIIEQNETPVLPPNFREHENLTFSLHLVEMVLYWYVSTFFFNLVLTKLRQFLITKSSSFSFLVTPDEEILLKDVLVLCYLFDNNIINDNDIFFLLETKLKVKGSILFEKKERETFERKFLQTSKLFKKKKQAYTPKR